MQPTTWGECASIAPKIAPVSTERWFDLPNVGSIPAKVAPVVGSGAFCGFLKKGGDTLPPVVGAGWLV